MKKILGIIMCITLSLGFFSCSDSSDDGGSDLPSATAISADVEEKKAEKGAAYTENVTLDLTSNPLTDDGIEEIKKNPAAYLRQSRVDASRAAAGSEDKGLDGFTVSIKEITKIKIEFEITATTPSTDCSVMITAIIPPEATESKKPFVQLVTQVKVGSGAGESSIEKIEGFSLPTKENLEGLILKGNNGSDDDDDAVYYEFTEENGEIIVNEYYVHTEYRNEKPHATYKYNKSTGELKEIVDSEHGDAMSSAMSSLGMSLHLVMIDNQYYIYNMVVSRSAGKDLDSTFSWGMDINESVTGEAGKPDKSITMAKVTGSVRVEIKTTSAGVFTGAMVSNAKFAYTSEFKNAMLTMGMDLSNVPAEYKEMLEKEMAEAKKQMDEMYKDMSTSETSDITGVYVNNKGVLTVNGKTVSTSTGPDYDDESGKMVIKTKTDVDEFSNGKAFYDGTKLYFGESFEKVSKLPEVDPYSYYW